VRRKSVPASACSSLERGPRPGERGPPAWERGPPAWERGPPAWERGPAPLDRGPAPRERGRSPAEARVALRAPSPVPRRKVPGSGAWLFLRGPLAARLAVRAPPVEGRSVRRGCSSPRWVARPRACSGDDVRSPRRGRSAADRCESRRVPSRPAPRDVPGCVGAFAGLAVRRGPSAPSARRLLASCPAPPASGLPRPWPADPPDGRCLLPGVLGLLPAPEAVRPAFAAPPPARPPLAPLPRGVPRLSATQTNLQHLCHNSTQTSEEGRSTSSGAALFKHVRRRPTLPRGPPRSTIGAEELNFRVRNGTGCFPFAITAETLLRCHRPRGPLRWPGDKPRSPAMATVSREPHSGRKHQVK
jgi:hypothetical protein